MVKGVPQGRVPGPLFLTLAYCFSFLQPNLHDHSRTQLCRRGRALGQRLPGPGEEVPAGQRGQQLVPVPLQLLR